MPSYQDLEDCGYKWAGLWLGQLVLYAISFWYQNKPGITTMSSACLHGDIAISATKLVFAC